MKVVGIREVKDNLSAYLREVRRGKTVRITDRGKVVAELRPPSGPPVDESLYQRLVEEGKILAASRPFDPKLVTVPRGRPNFDVDYVNELIDADRAEDR